MQQNLFYSTSQKTLNLEQNLKSANKYRGFENINYDSGTTVKKFLDIVFGD
jgi:hypothetical protein